jgi:hypothetical protein
MEAVVKRIGPSMQIVSIRKHRCRARTHLGEQRAIKPIAYEKLRTRQDVEDMAR